MDENEDKAWWRPESSHGYGHLLPAGRSQWYLCAALCVTLTLSLSLLILMPSRFGSVDKTLSDLERSVSNLTESVSLHLSKLHEKVGSLEIKLSDLKRSVSNLTESVSFHSSKLPKKGEVGCPDGWYLHNSSCYFFSAYKASWYTARDSCRDMDATLLILTDEEEASLTELVWVATFGLACQMRGQESGSGSTGVLTSWTVANGYQTNLITGRGIL